MILFPGSTIRIRLLLLVIVSVIPLFGLTLYTAAHESQSDIDHVQDEALHLARLIASVQERQVETTRQFLVTLALAVEDTHQQPAACGTLFSRLIQELPVYSDILLVDASGEVRARGTSLPSPSSVTDQPWFHRALENREFTVGERPIDELGDELGNQLGQEHSMVLCMPVRKSPEGSVGGIVCASMALDTWLSQALEHLPIPADTTVTVLNRRGTVLARYPDPERWTGRCMPECPAVKSVLSLSEGVADTIDVDNIPRICGFAPLRRTTNGDYINVGIRKETALADVRRRLTHNLLLLGFISGLTFVVALVSADLILLGRVRPLMSATERLMKGDLGARTGIRYGRSELSQLARTFDQMADALEIRQTESEELQGALENVGRQFRSIFDNAFQFTAVLEPDGTLLEANRTALDFVGLTNADVAHRPFWETPWWTVSDAVRQRLKEAVAEAAGGGVVRYEVENAGSGGRIVTVDFSIKPLSDEKGEVRFLIAEGRDISERKRAQAEIETSQARYRAVVEDQTELISRYSPDMKLTFVNGAYCRYFGELKEEVLGREFWHHVLKKDRERLREHIESIDMQSPVATIQHRVLTESGKQRWLKWTDRAIFDEKGRIVEYQAVGRDITDSKEAEESLRRSERDLRLLSSQLLTAQEDERKRIARELHDSTGQSLSAIKFGVEKALAQIGKDAPPEGLKSLEDLVATVQYSIDELRRIMRDLRPSILDDLGLVVTINWFCRDFQKIYSSIQIHKTVDVQEEEIPEPLKIVLFRVVQEALNNVAKHSDASTLELSLKRGPAGIELAIDDDGKGFSMETPARDEKTKISFGLSSMRERVEASGGSFSIRSIQGEGTYIRAGWPCVFRNYRSSNHAGSTL